MCSDDLIHLHSFLIHPYRAMPSHIFILPCPYTSAMSRGSSSCILVCSHTCASSHDHPYRNLSMSLRANFLQYPFTSVFSYAPTCLGRHIGRPTSLFSNFITYLYPYIFSIICIHPYPQKHLHHSMSSYICIIPYLAATVPPPPFSHNLHKLVSTRICIVVSCPKSKSSHDANHM